MNISVYLPQKLISRLSHVAEQQHTSKNSIIREAVEEWITNHCAQSSWPLHFFDFDGVKEVPDFSSYREELSVLKEVIF